jgi:hypothetical protein
MNNDGQYDNHAIAIRNQAFDDAIKEARWIIPRSQTGLRARLIQAIEELKIDNSVKQDTPSPTEPPAPR